MVLDARQIVVFDGMCNLCAHSIAFILAHERYDAIRFAAAQSPAGRALLSEFGLEPERLATFVFTVGGTARVRSDAALEVARHLRFPWRLLRILCLIPRPFRDSIYDFMARNRYRWLGKRESCRVATPEQRSRFIDGEEEAVGTIFEGD
jgi:predicted DCC family thiol-disulfide oxidoreductase YuxK